VLTSAQQIHYQRMAIHPVPRRPPPGHVTILCVGILEKRGPRWIVLGPVLSGIALVMLIAGGSLGQAMTWIVYGLLALCVVIVTVGLWPGPRRPNSDK
jgi:hypothetical protein